MRCVASYRMLDEVIPCPDAVPLILSKSASSLLLWPHALSTVMCVSVVSPSLDLIMVNCAVCSLLMHRVCHHRHHQVIPPLPRLAGPPAPSYRWIHEMWYGGLRARTPSYCYCTRQCGFSTMHFTALRASMCCNGVHDACAVFVEATVTLSCACHMRVAVDEVWVEHGVIGSHLDRPHCIVLWICCVYCIAEWLHTVEVRSHIWSRGNGASSAGCGC